MEAIVEYDYVAQEPDELTLRKGDIITNIRAMPGGWWEGTSKDKRGMFPDNFVKVLEPCSSNSLNNSTEMKNEIEGLKIERKDDMKKKYCKVLFKYDASNDDELSMVPNDIIEYLGEVEDGWWSGCLKGRVGVFPSNFVAPPEELESTKEYCRVLFPYEADNDDELTLTEGEIITLITRDAPDKGWWKGELRGKIGLFPDNFVEVISSKHLSPLVSYQPQSQQSSDSNRSSLNSLKQLSLGKKSTKTDRKSFESTVEKKLISPSIIPSNHSIISNLQRVMKDKNNVSSTDSGSKTIDLSVENNFDKVEREEEAPLSHLTVLRAKAPRRRLPSTYITRNQIDTLSVNLAQNSSSLEKENTVINGNLDTVDQSRDKENDVSAKTRQTVPWIKELKQNQMEKKKSLINDKNHPQVAKSNFGIDIPGNINNNNGNNNNNNDDNDANNVEVDVDGDNLLLRDENVKELDSNQTDFAPPTASRKTPAYVPYRLYYQLLDRVTTLEEKQTVLQRTVAQLSEQIGPLLANEAAANKV